MLILMVCSGNTCRSPLAAAMLAAKLQAEPGFSHIQVTSAGTGASEGEPISNGSYLVGLERGLDLSGHRARRITPELLQQADLILAMGENHVDRIKQLEPDVRVTTITNFASDVLLTDIPDPWGGDLPRYRMVASLLDPMLDRVVAVLAQQQHP